ncbi:5-methyltetrahydropteroyltriglutamate--homocysteine S-methyltransferase [Pseudoxanthomonas winnipegensis]|uniref:5-methyltetrahydropteroyltriglutamate--homocysteine methyltransferase n=1 Tax=Pseudoxanthomonas winnipegensis TaxID=2480810 RepID=A0ABY1WAC7_9GAMM|nr:5-methyltetrahydropteroyltriglutamate--homocysteine S-methyltransferase [Pseudoxanthomonas winnipegensis]TAA07450.1 5-methyltetrahydropteroyltriglutamate--homocysteine S-methyltransferase [Pseudoxanthomonas winnipegensis]TAA17478.1 5-methyltetrahydropteroyltriglutamate--homocysteine S-methyltransferase [Pseudoxanthomonas winnipegensis]TAH71197.1 5-methyltetrahydropteroyltriglutamate--homocysteine S-methyltransferase [Pseudoxanthomonas winnipegensis]
MTSVTNLGFPRIGPRRELKHALERYWKGEDSADTLQATAAALRAQHWQLQRQAGADVLPSNDFSLYDHVLDTAFLFDALPQRYRALADADPLAGYFAMARGVQTGGIDLRALEMTKWFDTNYHYIVPELHAGQEFALRGDKPVAQFLEARAAGFDTRPVLLGPVSFLLLSKTTDGSDRLALLERLLPVYAQLLERLHAAGAAWVQIDEPTLVLDLDEAAKAAFARAYAFLAQAPRSRLLLTTYFGALGDNLDLVARLQVEGLHVDLVRAPEQLDAVLQAWPKGRVLSAGLVNGRNVWRTNLDNALTLARYAQGHVGADNLWLAPSCALLHVPVDLEQEKALDAELKSWLSFARQKLGELRVLADALDGREGAEGPLAQQRARLESRRQSARVHRPEVARRLATLSEADSRRASPYAQRRVLQEQAFGLPVYPTTTIGSFPQTQQVRQARAQHKAGKLSDADYETFLEAETERCVRFQERIGLDVLVHGEYERNDMVEYFGEQLDGFAFTKLGWVQSYGSRCVKPPIIFGDVVRPKPMTVRWSRYAQSLTQRPMKGMLTGPVTVLQWSFVRDDQARSETCRQIALALRDEVNDLEAAGIGIIQIDEPAIREGLPLRRDAWSDYLNWAIEAFRICASGVGDATQIHTHMCYSEFNDIIDAVAAMDADVISIETSRSRMELLDAFVRFRYPNGIGPGVYDIHSPRVPSVEEMVELLRKARAVLSPEQLWVNPDCGLKTRGWDETRHALEQMVEAARRLRADLAQAA